jgi:hypothetical protein
MLGYKCTIKEILRISGETNIRSHFGELVKLKAFM